MIKRYTLPEIGNIWTQENKYRKWLEVELAVCEVLAEKGEIPKEAWKEIEEKADFDSQRIDQMHISNDRAIQV